MQEIRNIAIIAHVDHGKTTLVDRILHQVEMFRDNQEVQELILDSNDLERERGITILSKNVSVRYNDVKINIIDTPGHSDFGGEVERVLNMADGVLLVVDAPKVETGILQIQISSLDYSSYVGRIAVGRIVRGSIKVGDSVAVTRKDGSFDKTVVKELYLFEGLGKVKVKHPIDAGEICAVLVQSGFDIGDTITNAETPEALPRISVDAPTMSMLFTLNNSPFFGKEGKFITSRQIRDRLMKETEKNLALRVDETESADKWLVYGRGIMHLSVLIETMRREGFEFQVGQPQVVITKSDRLVLDFSIPSRGLIGITNPLLTATKGEAVISHRFKAFEPWKGNIDRRRQGSLVAMETGKVLAYALDKLQSRGRFFVDPIEQVYEGQVVGEHVRDDDIVVNVIKAKKQTNVRAASADDKVAIAPAVKMSLEQIMEYIKEVKEDEYVELTPKSIRMRKIMLKEIDRKRYLKSKE